MTRQRNDEHSTEFGLWLRKRPELDSKVKGFTTTNLDYIWMNYRTRNWMMIEEKRYMSEMSYAQEQALRQLYKGIFDKNFYGFHLLQFENTDPDDGKIFLDHKEISRQELIDFLQFKPLSCNVLTQSGGEGLP